MNMTRKKETKIVILGSADSGKTTTLETLLNRKNEKITKIECNGTTVSLDYGNTIINGEKIHIFGSPGQERFQFMREILSNGLSGAIVVIDNSKGITNTDIHIIETLNNDNIPYVIFANKQDIAPGNLESEYIEPHIPVIPTSARKGAGIQEGFKVLLELV